MIIIKLFMGALTTIGTIYGAIQGASAIKKQVSKYKVVSKEELNDLEEAASNHNLKDEDIL